MSNQVAQPDVGSMSAALEQVAERMAETGDSQHAGKLRDLDGKLTDGKLAIAFCGHFSAGKSTLVNQICGTNLLPSSPIPTSANVVTIASGEPKAVIERVKDGITETVEAPLELLDAYCKDGESVKSIALSYPIPRIGEHTVLLDTPGIDSTDDAHRMATESALHMADVVFYVMDYNHVMSEINFTFAKQLKEWGKPLYLIVNQIDKHRDRELSFAAYRQSVEEGFANWHLEPSGILYLSLRHPDHPHSEWEKLERLLAELAPMRRDLSLCSVYDSAAHLLRAHAQWVAEQHASEREALLEAAGGEEESAQVKAEIDALNGRLAEIREQQDMYRTKLLGEAQSLLDNAIVMPAATRDLAQSFLESRKPGFKMGLLFAGAKTAAEQERRLAAFRDDFAAKVEANIEWHLKDLLRRSADALGWRDATLEERLEQSLQLEIKPERLIGLIQQGAVFSGEYTMNYSRELASDVKAEYRRLILPWVDELAARAAESGESEAVPLRERLRDLSGQASALEALTALARRENEHEAELTAMLPEAPARPAMPIPLKTAETQPASHGASQANEKPDASLKGNTGEIDSPQSLNQTWTAYSEQSDALGPQREAAKRLKAAVDMLAPHAALAGSVATMREKAERLTSSQFTIALFGAFSAGKSSLANGLLGDSVLPVSPNPTTAAVNRIVPPTEERPHGTATVVMKDRAAMIGDLLYSLKLLGETADGLDERAILQAIGKLSPDAVHAGGRPHYSFLKAAARGWQEHEALLGTKLAVDNELYRKYVAEESRSCFVSEIVLHHANALTAQGIVLVDTPGADSVNARHTGVAFNYIKNADAILFVTYYNHAFSQADRQFLLQLGRVKDQFELDKMFFIVNAADLAASDEELQGVLAHVERNLQQHGIRFPRMFPVSSLLALEGKQTGSERLLAKSGIAAFEQSFLSFARGDLGKLAIESAEEEIRRARRTIEEWLRSAQGDAASREAERKRIESRAAEAIRLSDAVADRGLNPQLEQELRELLFYVQQRLGLRFGDHFNYAFNPSSLQDDGRDLKRAIWTSWLELARLLQIELSQELQATSLRLDNALNRLAAKRHGDTAEEIAKLLEGYAPSAYKPLAPPTPEEPREWEADSVTGKWLWSRFKSPRQFFEGEGKAQLRKALEAEIAAPLARWFQEVEEAWAARYRELWQQATESSSQLTRSDIDAFVQGKLHSLSGDADVTRLQALGESLAGLTSSN
ncbi:dynamin family protein [Paenibacillus xanthanilyticus]|uniref:Dynamin family protein n=1 Tax=Paenibacillus xanthanilyticus TaxID=1783531 RepID=A0ABV8K4S7_9BACL